MTYASGFRYRKLNTGRADLIETFITGQRRMSIYNNENLYISDRQRSWVRV